MAKLTSDQGWHQFTNTMAKAVPRDLYRSKRVRKGLVALTKKVQK